MPGDGMNAPVCPSWFWTLAAEMAAQAPHPAEGVYAQLRRDFDEFFEGTPEQHQEGVQRLAKLCGV